MKARHVNSGPLTKAHRVGLRIFEPGAQPLTDWLVCYADGTTDAISLSPTERPPVANQYFGRLGALNGALHPTVNFLTWTPAVE